MADNISITPGTGKDVATDEVTGTGEHVQVVKLAIATDGSRTAIPADGTDGLLVNLGTNNDVAVASIAAGDNNIGNVDIVTVPAPLNVTGNGAASSALRVTLANDTTGKVIVSDGTNNIDIDVAPTDGETNGGKRLLHTESWLWGYNGSTWDRLRSDTTNGLDVDVTRVSGNVTVVQSTASNLNVAATLGAETTKVIGTVNVSAGQSIAVTQGTAASLNCTEASAGAIKTAVELIDDTVFSDDAGFTPGTSKVLAVGFMADETSTDIVNEGDVGIARMTLDRRQIVQIGESGEKDVVGGGSKTDTTDQAIMAAAGSGVYNVLTWLVIYNSSATNTFATLKDGSTTRAVIPLPAYGGATFMPPRGIRSTANTAWNIAAGTGVTTAYFYGGGFTCQS